MTLLLLFFLQLIWASSYVAQKMALAEMPPGLVLIFRYGLAALALALLGQLKLKEKFSPWEWGLIIFSGVVNFSGSPLFQLKALQLTYAVDVSILVAFEPLITALLAVLFLKEKMSLATVATFFVAASGVIVMSGWRGDALSLQWGRLLGDSFFLLSLCFEGLCSTAAKHLSKKYNPLPLIGWMILFGFATNLLGNFRLLSPAHLKAVSPAGWISLIYLALFCSVIGYGGWFYLLKKIPLSRLALSLFLQPILGTILACVILKEKLDRQTIFGALIVLSSLLVWLVRHLPRNFRGFPDQKIP